MLRDGELIRQGDAKIAAGEDVLHLREVAGEPGLHRYDVEVSALDPKLDEAAEDNSGSAFVRVRGEAVALVLEGDPPLAGALAHALESAAFKVQVAGATGVPADLGGFAAYDLIVLCDIAAASCRARSSTRSPPTCAISAAACCSWAAIARSARAATARRRSRR